MRHCILICFYHNNAKKSTHIVAKPLYLPYLALCDYWLVGKNLKGECVFDTIRKIKTDSKVLTIIQEKYYFDCFEDWKMRWKRCVLSDGDYFEEDEIDLEE